MHEYAVTVTLFVKSWDDNAEKSIQEKAEIALKVAAYDCNTEILDNHFVNCVEQLS